MDVDNSMIAVSVLIVGMTESDLMKSRARILEFLPIFLLKPSDENLLFVIKVMRMNGYPVMNLHIEEGYFDLFSETHHEVEFSMNIAQPGIWEQTH